MTDLGTFRAVLQGPDPIEGRPAPLAEIMVAGRQLRRRRRFAAAAVAVGLCLAVLGTGVAVQQNKAAPASSDIYSPPGSWGAAVQTGIYEKYGQLVITAIHYNQPASPGVTFGLRLCWAQPDGSLHSCLEIGKAKAPERAPGFEVISLPSRFDDVGDTPMFGYFVGAASRITARSDGRNVVAQTAVWSEDPNVVIWWFPLEQIPVVSGTGPKGEIKQHAMTDWAAYDDQGTLLPTGTLDFYQP